MSSCLVDLIGVARLSFFRSSCYNMINVIQGCLLNLVMNANFKTLYHCKLKWIWTKKSNSIILNLINVLVVSDHNPNEVSVE